jgi:transposase
VRETDGRNAEPSAGLIDSQSIRTADTVPAVSGKKVKGRKRFLVTDTLGLLIAVQVVAASVQDRDGARRPLLWARLDHPQIQKFWADQGFAGRLVDWTTQIVGRKLVIVRKGPRQRGFQIQPKRWAIERTFSWLTAHRRLARDYETIPARSETVIRCRHHGPQTHPWQSGNAAGPAPARTHRSRTRYLTQLSGSRTSGVPSTAGPQPAGRCEATSLTASSAESASPTCSCPEPCGSCSRRTRNRPPKRGKIEGKSCDQGKRVHRLNCSDP